MYQILLLVLLLTAFSKCIFSAEISFTIDDPGVQATSGMNHLQVAEKILQTLHKHQLKTILFVCGKRIDNADGKKLLTLWDKENHLIANHSYSHLNYNNEKIDFNFFSQDIIKNEELISAYNNFRKIFRYPMLKEGNTLQKRDTLRTFLKDRGYSLGYVTIDASDWYISDRLVAKINKGEKINLDAYKKYYLEHMWNRTQYYNQLSKEILGREIKHNILLHHNPLNAYFLNDLIEMFKNKGWKLINAEVALKDPAYSLAPNTLPAGESLLWAIAKESGKYEDKLRYPAEDSEYQKEEMDKLKL